MPIQVTHRRGRRASALLRTVCIACVLAGGIQTALGESVLRRGTAGEPASLDLHVATGNSASPILYDLFVGLTTYDQNGRVVPGVAESWEVADDGLAWTFTLRDDARWSDGSPLTASDFVYSARRAVDPATAARFASFFYPVRNARAIVRGRMPPEMLGVKAPDARHVQYELAHPAPYFAQIMAANIASPVPAAAIQEHGRRWTRAENMISNGPYKLAEWVPQSHVTLVRNPGFPDQDAITIDRVEYHPTQNLATSLNRFRAGELDVVLNFPPDEIEWLRKNLPDELRVSPSLALYYLLPNHRRPPFDDSRVRRALSLAIDRIGLVERLLPTGVAPSWSITPPGLSDYDGPAVDFAARDQSDRLTEARTLLAAAGYSAAKPLEFEYRYATQEENRKIAVALSAMWRAVGARVALVNVDFNSLNKSARTRDFDMLAYQWFAPYDDPGTFLALLQGGNPNNHSGYANTEYDLLLDAANAMLDPASRLVALSQAQSLAQQDDPFLPLYVYASRRLVSRDVVGWTDNTRGINPTRYLAISR
jgi:ABC-type oligopeptide transport system substrate-binding subunit